MKKTSKILLSSILAIALCLSLIAGSTFALFTSESKVNIAVTSGTVKVTATAENLKAYSGKWNETLGEYEQEDRTDEGSFTTGGTYALDGNQITLTNIVPMDGVTFDIRIKNESNVLIKYQIAVTITEGDGTILNDGGLKVSVDGQEFNGAITSSWASLEPNLADKIVPVSIELPNNEDDNNAIQNAYQGKTLKLSYIVNAVQGNAHTETAALNTTLTSGGTVVLSEDVATNEIIKVSSGAVLDGGGNTINCASVDTSGWLDYGVTLSNGTLRNATVVRAGYAIGSQQTTGTVTIENVTTDYCTYAINGGGSSEAIVNVINSNINGWISYADIAEFNFTSCKLAKGNSGYGYLVVYGDTSFTDCTFEDFQMCGRDGHSGTVIFTNCKYSNANGTITNVTADNFKELFCDMSDSDVLLFKDYYTIVIDGVAVQWN